MSCPSPVKRKATVPKPGLCCRFVSENTPPSACFYVCTGSRAACGAGRGAQGTRGRVQGAGRACFGTDKGALPPTYYGPALHKTVTGNNVPPPRDYGPALYKLVYAGIVASSAAAQATFEHERASARAVASNPNRAAVSGALTGAAFGAAVGWAWPLFLPPMIVWWAGFEVFNEVRQLRL
jgi:hypothetical protein